MPGLKELIKTQLDLLKSMGKDRRTIERDLGYSDKYIDQALSKGGNDKLLQALTAYKDKLESGNYNAGPFNAMEIIFTQQQTINTLSKNLEKALTRIEELESKIAGSQGNTGGRRRSA